MNTLETEFKAREFIHKTAIVGGALMRNYIIANSKGVALPPHILQEQADEYSNKVMQKALQEGTFETLYNSIWEQLKDVLPENLKLM